MIIYVVKKFFANGWQEGHTDEGEYTTREKAEARFKELGLVTTEHGPLWSDYIDEKEID